MPKALIVVIISFVASAVVILAGYFAFFVYKNWDTAQRSVTAPTKTQNVTKPSITIQNQEPIAGKEYYTALNNSISDIKAITATNNKLTPILTELSNQNQQKNYTNFFNLVINVKTLTKEGTVINNKLNKDIQSLSEASSTVRDQQVKTETVIFIKTGENYNKTLNTYLLSVNNLLNGHIPTQEEIAALKDNVNNLTIAASTFSDQTKFLLDLLSRKSQEINAQPS